MNDVKALKEAVGEQLQKELDGAISSGQGGNATALTEELIEKQTQLAQAATELIVSERFVESFEKKYIFN